MKEYGKLYLNIFYGFLQEERKRMDKETDPVRNYKNGEQMKVSNCCNASSDNKLDNATYDGITLTMGYCSECGRASIFFDLIDLNHRNN